MEVSKRRISFKELMSQAQKIAKTKPKTQQGK
jgi:hypothetical protein